MKIGQQIRAISMRKYFSFSILAAFSLFFLGCEQLSENNSDIGQSLTVNATYDNGNSKATVVDGGTSVYWEPNDEIKVFCGQESGRLVSTNVENSKTATFTGTVSGEVNPSTRKKLYALYPYREDASFDDGVITTILPEVQTAVAGSFDRNANIALAASESTDLLFRNVCGGLRFTLTHPGIKRIVFESNGGEYISGELSVQFKDGVPVVKEVKNGSSKVTLETEDGSAFETGVWYYMSFLPTTLTAGYSISFSTETEGAVTVVSKAQVVTRGTYGTISEIDADLDWEELENFGKLKIFEEENSAHVFGFANNNYAFCLDYSEESTYSISVSGPAEGMTVYVDSEFNVNRIINRDGEYVEFIKDPEGNIDILYFTKEGGFKRVQDSGINESDLRAEPYVQTRAGNVMNYTDVALSVLGVFSGIKTGLEGALFAAGITNTAWIHSSTCTVLLSVAGVGVVWLSGAGEVALLYAAALGVANVTKAAIDEIQNYQAENLYMGATVTTESVVQVTKEKVIASARIGSFGDSAPYGCELSVIGGGGLVITKNWHSSEGIDIGRNKYDETDFLFDNVSSSKGYRAVLRPENEQDIWAGTKLDYWKYGEVIRQDYEEEPIKIGKVDLLSSSKSTEEIVEFKLRVPVATNNEAFYDEWGVIVVDEDGKEYEKFKMDSGLKGEDFEVTVKIPMSEMEKDETDGKYWPKERKTRYLVPYCGYHSIKYLDVSNKLFYPLSYTPEEGCPDENHIHAIDLGLSVKWACCNVGATRPEEYGGYYAWGETEEKSVYTDVTYKYAHGIDKDGDGWYETNLSYDNIGSDISGSQYDVAHVKWGGSWRMPTEAEFIELNYNCTSEWTTLNGVYGRKFTSRKNGNSIFLPAAGYRYDDDFLDVGSDGYYWVSLLYPGNPGRAYDINFFSGDVFSYMYFRYYGQSVRPVSE